MINTPDFFKVSLLALACGTSTLTCANGLDLKPGGTVDAYGQAATGLEQLAAEKEMATKPLSQEIPALDETSYLMLDTQDAAPEVFKTLPRPSVKVPLKPAQERVSLTAETAAITPLCPTLNIDTLYTLSNSTAGSASCYHFEITQRAKTTVFLVGQNPQTDANLTLFRHEAGDSLTVMGSSANTGNSDEAVLALTEPGHYYWYIDVVAADGGDFNFAAVANTAIDSYEYNDTVATSTALPDKMNRVSGNMDSATDVDYYHFTAVRGQDTSFTLYDSYSNNEWQLELYNGGWQVLESNKTYSLSSLQPNQTLNIRVSPNPAVAVNTSHNYQLAFGSKAARLGDYSVEGEGEPGLARVPLNATGTYLTTQAHKNLRWDATILDSSGQPLEGIEVKLRVDKNVDDNPDNFLHFVDYSLVTGSNGQVAGNVDLGTCYGGHTSLPHYQYRNGIKSWWETDFNYGAWRLEVPGYPGIGVGGDVVQYVVLGHICKQNYLYSE
ncbi:hypothetical protein SG34_005180 [Thalassomonas viridans]|uniref:Peptidase C-terminal archaeal/bacterial domain-containing protein n=1 Tax=Thalassomonas viridans TaxID=137584 RepID=A0AAE9Z5A2_9GAMM|nr:hypothetical protein [Thalassomonas viridans]WDE06319.1 hypothetical protein SG34_005180 [Thalassomonas viridans]